eukprot:GHRQ01005258.1.p1 GENE.GHRQ01005258.1~~GHRQ01005258.1.p1  ORF type:complete len:487 (+),score=147.82 GHRQ01005258.1:737-2197(+)
MVTTEACRLLWLLLVLGCFSCSGSVKPCSTAASNSRQLKSVWPFSGQRPAIRTGAKCNKASMGHVWRGDSIYEELQEFLRVNGPLLHLPREVTDITTATTIMQLAAPDIQLVLDPLLYLKVLPEPSGIPKLVHMTVKDKRQVAPHQLLSMLSWGRFNKGYALLLYDDADIEQYMQQFYPAFMPTFHQLKTAVEKSDAWRYHVLCGHGGIYTDTDTICARPFSEWTNFNSTPEPGLLVGIEDRFYTQEEAEEATYVHKTQITQWTMASKRAHPVVCRMGGAIKAFVEQEAADGGRIEQQMGHDASILLRTGPGIWSREVHSYLQQMGSQPEDLVEGGQVTDAVVLPQAAFGCNFRYWSVENTESYVYHMYNNSWKVDHFRVADFKKQQRHSKQRQHAMRLVYPLLIIMSACCGVLAAVYAGLCWLPAHSGTRFGARKKRRALQAIAVGGSSPRKGSPRGSPSRLGSGSSSITLSSRLQQQHWKERQL